MTTVQLHDPSTAPATMSVYERSAALMRAPLTQPCPFCPAQPDDHCRSKSGNVVPTHDDREKLVADWSDDEKLAAFGALRREADARRAESIAHMERAKNDPNVQRQRTWWDEQIGRIDADIRAAELDFRSRCTDAPFAGHRTHADDCRCIHTGVVVHTLKFVAAVRERLRLEALAGELPVTDLAEVRAMRGAR